MTYLLPRSIEEALDVISQGDHKILAGGTDVYPATGGRCVKGPVIDISGLEEIIGINDISGGIRIGGLTTWTDIAKADLPEKFRALQLAAREVGAVQIQNVATVAGNLCNASPAADGVPPLLALNAQVELTSLSGVRELPLDQFILGNRRTAIRPDELLTAVIIPDDLGRTASHFIKLGSRKYLVISIVMVAVILEVDDGGLISQARVAVGACSEVAQRLSALEKALMGVQIDKAGDLVDPEHFSNLSPISDVRATAQYRQNAATEIVRRAASICAGALK